MSKSTSNTKIAGVRRSKKYQALIAVGLDDAAALRSLGVTPPVNGALAELLAAGFSEDEARQALARKTEVTPAPAPAPLTVKEQGEALVTAQGLVFTRGRVYVTPDVIEAAVRVRKTGSPEVVRTSGVGRTKAVLVTKEETGDVSIQNLTLA